MKQLVLLLASILLYSIVCSQEIRGKRISCVDGIPLECLKTGDVLQGEEVAYEVKKDVSSLFLKNRNNRYDTLGIEDGYQKGHVYVANTGFDSLRYNIWEIVYNHLTREEIDEVICQGAGFRVFCVLDSCLCVREVVFGLSKNPCDFDEIDKGYIAYMRSRFIDSGISKDAIETWEKAHVERTFNKHHDACFWRTYPVDRFRAIEKRIIAKARLNEEDDYYSEVKKNGCWKNYFVVNVESKILERMRENGGSIPEESVLYEIFYREFF